MQEDEFVAEFMRLKKASGGHSPSLGVMRKALNFEPRVDACYLSNPFATDVVASLISQQLASGDLWNFLDRYPSQSRDLAPFLENIAGVPAQNLVVCNGVAEVIPYLLRRKPGATLISIPTFSAYHELAAGDLIYHESLEADPQLRKEAFVRRAKEVRPATAVVINPNNPDGFTYSRGQLFELVSELREYCDQVIVDESFAGLVFPAPVASAAELALKYDNVVVVRSLSKEYGIAGLRIGYAAMAESQVELAYRSGFLWNINGLGELFLRSLAESRFSDRLEEARAIYLATCADFIPQVSRLSSEKIPSSTNFALLKVASGESASVLSAQLAYRSGVYVRSCEDKLGLSDSYLRVAARRPEENEYVLEAVGRVLADSVLV